MNKVYSDLNALWLESKDTFNQYDPRDIVQDGICSVIVDTIISEYNPDVPNACRKYGIELTQDDLDYDDGNSALEESFNALAEEINKAKPIDLPGTMSFVWEDGAYVLILCVDIQDLEEHD